MKCDELKRFDIVGKYRDEETMQEFRPDGECYDADDVDAAIAELKAMVTTDNSAVIANLEAELHKAQRALWLARAERAAAWHTHFALCHNHSAHRQFCINGSSLPTVHMTMMRAPAEWCALWKRIHNKLATKAKEFE